MFFNFRPTPYPQSIGLRSTAVPSCHPLDLAITIHQLFRIPDGQLIVRLLEQIKYRLIFPVVQILYPMFR